MVGEYGADIQNLFERCGAFLNLRVVYSEKQ